MATKYTVSTVFRAIDQYSKQVSTMTSATNTFASSVSRVAAAASKKLDGMAGSLDKVVGVAARVAAPMGAAGAVAVKSAMDFEDALVGASTKFGKEFYKGTDGYNMLAKAAMDASKSGLVGFTESAAALGNLGAAGLDGVTAMGALNNILALSKVSGASLEESADMAVNAMGALGLASDKPAEQIANLQRVSEIMAKGSDLTSASLTDMAEAIKIVGPIANGMKVPLEQTGAALTVLASGGIMGTMAGTGAANMMKRLSAQSGPAVKYMKQLGFEAVRTADGGLDLVKTLDAMRESTKDLDVLAKADIIRKIVGDEAGTAVTAALNKTNAEWAKFTNAMGGAPVLMDKFGQMAGTSSAKLGQMRNSLERAGMSLGQSLLPKLLEAGGKFTEWTSNIGAALQSSDRLRGLLAGGLYNALVGVGRIMLALYAVSWALRGATWALTVATWAWRAITIAANATAVSFVWTLRALAFMYALGKKETWQYVGALLYATYALVAQNVVSAIAAVKMGLVALNVLFTSAAFGVMAGAVWAAILPALIIIGVIALIVGALVLLYKKNETFANFVDRVWGTIRDTISGAIDAVMGPINWLLDSLGMATRGLGDMQDAGNGIASMSNAFGSRDGMDYATGNPYLTNDGPQLSMSSAGQGGGQMDFAGELGINLSGPEGFDMKTMPELPGGVNVKQLLSGGM